MGITRLIGPTKSGSYVVNLELITEKHLYRAIVRILKYYCRNSKNYQVVFEANGGAGARHFTISVDSLLYGGKPNAIVDMLLSYNNDITGIVANDIEEANEIATEIEKGHMWDLLKE